MATHPYFVTLKVLLTTPTTPTERMKAIVEVAEGFVYLVSFCVIDYQDPLVEKLISFCTGHMQMHACCICVFKYICICQNNLFFLPQSNVHSKVISVLQLVDN